MEVHSCTVLLSKDIYSLGPNSSGAKIIWFPIIQKGTAPYLLTALIPALPILRLTSLWNCATFRILTSRVEVSFSHICFRWPSSEPYRVFSLKTRRIASFSPCRVAKYLMYCLEKVICHFYYCFYLLLVIPFHSYFPASKNKGDYFK